MCSWPQAAVHGPGVWVVAAQIIGGHVHVLEVGFVRTEYSRTDSYSMYDRESHARAIT